ncbi:MAG: DUF4198 domain-containing protein [Hyphomonadaceae bacterium]
MKQYLLAAAALLAAATVTPASAYTSYLKPSAFWADEAEVQVEGAFATQFFTPEIALGDRITLLNPDGQSMLADQIAVTPNATELATALASSGTYRISTGEVLGQVATLVAQDGQWRVLGAGEATPEGADTTTLQTVTIADTYVTRGAATRTVVDHTMGTLAIRPVTHPNQILSSQGLEIELTFNGAPMANSAIVLYRAGEQETSLDRFVVTDENGHATFTFDGPGQYIIAARHRADMPPGSAANVGSYTTTLTFEALAQLHPETEISEPSPAPQRRRRPSRTGIGRLGG